MLHKKLQLLFYLLIGLSSFVISCRKELKETGNTVSSAETNNGIAAAAKPNILIIVGDDIGYEVPTCDGGQSYSTPNIDFLAAGGKRYVNCYASPLCSPSRFMLLTGKYNFRNYTQWGIMGRDQKTIGNLLNNAGYATCYTGKWQLDGGDTSIKTFGWQKYSVWLPYYQLYEEFEGSRYRDSRIYQDGGYMPPEYSMNKYSDDIFTNYLLQFTDSMKKESNPFFAFYSMVLCHQPWSPTPDDVAFKRWNFAGFNSDTAFFPNMVKYMDKKIGQIINHLDSTGQLNNTVIFYVGDNGSSNKITSFYNGYAVVGTKSASTEIGTSVPLIVYRKGKIAPSVNTTIISFSDIMPTLADIAKTSIPASYGVIDGISFNSTFKTTNDLQIRDNIYNAYMNNVYFTGPFERWAQTTKYKLYDSVVREPTSGQFVKVQKCRPDTVLDISNLTPDEINIRNNLLKVLDAYRSDTASLLLTKRKKNN